MLFIRSKLFEEYLFSKLNYVVLSAK